MPTFRTLETSEMQALLARNHVGRIAYSFHDDVNIEPINYVYADEFIYVRTSPGHKVRTLEHHRWVAFEVDEVAGPYDWSSVVVHGGVYLVEPGETPQGHEIYERTVSRLRTIMPNMLAEDDPAPHRNTLLRIHVDRMTGRSATSG